MDDQIYHVMLPEQTIRYPWRIISPGRWPTATRTVIVFCPYRGSMAIAGTLSTLGNGSSDREGENRNGSEPVLGVDWLVINKKTRSTYAVLSFTGVHHLRSGL